MASDFIQEYFVNPLSDTASYAPYNLVNTLVFAAIALAAAYLIFRYLQKNGIPIDRLFFRAIIPFVFLGSFVRVLEDSHFLPRSVEIMGITTYPFVTPYIYVLTFLIVMAAIAAARKITKTHEECTRLMRRSGITLAVFMLLILLVSTQGRNYLALAEIAGLALAATLVFMFLDKKRGNEANFREKTLFASQALDGSATFIGVSFLGYSEQHVVGNAIFALGTPLAFFAIKIVFALLAIELIRREKLKEDEKTYLLLLITIFGLAPGVRDATRIFLGV